MKKVVLIVLVIVCFILFIKGCSVKKVDELTDAELFANEYNISSDNPFVYVDYKQVIEILDTNGIILFGNSDYEGTYKAVELINEVAKKNNIEKIYYFNPVTLSKENPKNYEKLLNKITEDKDFELRVPDLYSIKDGKIINHSNYFSKEEDLSEEDLTNKKLKKIKQKYSNILNYIEEE